MKKILFIIVLIISFNVVNLNSKEEDIFTWGDFDVKVEVGEDIQEVLNEVKKNIKLKEGYVDPEFYVENNYVNYTTQSSINTNYMKVYRLDHRAVSPKYRKEAVRSYYFHIVDTTPPKVISSVSFKIAFGETEPDYLKGIVVTDNYTKKEDIEIIVNKSNVNYSKVGIYEILFTIIDSSGNKTFHTEYLEIVDVIKPSIIKIKDLTHEVSLEFFLDDYFLITDNYDKDLNISYKINGDINTLGHKEIIVTAKDSSGNIETYYDVILVIDETPPIIEPLINIVEVNVFEEIDLTSLVVVSDNYDEINIEDLKISHNINYDVVGNYNVLYEIEDSSNNKGILNLTILVKDLIPPEIHVEDLKILKGTYKNFLMYASVSDNYSEEININLDIIYNDVDFNNSGIYLVTFEAVDEYGNHTNKTITVTVEGEKEEIKVFYFVVIVGVLCLIVTLIIFVVKKRKKTF